MEFKEAFRHAQAGKLIRPEKTIVWMKLDCKIFVDDLGTRCDVPVSWYAVDTWEVKPEDKFIWMSEQGKYFSVDKPDPESHFAQYKKYKLVPVDD